MDTLFLYFFEKITALQKCIIITGIAYKKRGGVICPAAASGRRLIHCVHHGRNYSHSVILF
jgi:hypothetical protein